MASWINNAYSEVDYGVRILAMQTNVKIDKVCATVEEFWQLFNFMGKLQGPREFIEQW